MANKVPWFCTSGGQFLRMGTGDASTVDHCAGIFACRLQKCIQWRSGPDADRAAAPVAPEAHESLENG